MSSKSTILSLFGAVLGFGLSGGTAASAPETLAITTGDGASCSLDLYRPSAPVPVDVILLPDLAGSRAEWAAVAETLAARGCLVGCLDLRPLRGPARAKPVWGRAEDPLAPWTEAWREVEAARLRMRAESGSKGKRRTCALVGAGTGGAVAAVAASRLAVPPELLALVQPGERLAGIPIVPILAGLEMPVLLFCPLDASAAREVATDAYLACRPRSTLWMTGAALARPVRIFALRPQLAVDLADWIVGESSRTRAMERAAPHGDAMDERAR